MFINRSVTEKNLCKTKEVYISNCLSSLKINYIEYKGDIKYFFLNDIILYLSDFLETNFLELPIFKGLEENEIILLFLSNGKREIMITPDGVKLLAIKNIALSKIVTNKFEGKDLKDVCKKYLDELDIELFGEDLDRIVNISFDIFKLKEKQTEENLKFIKEKYKL